MSIQVGIIGFGFIGKLHADALRRINGVKLVAVCIQKGKEELAREYGIEKIYEDWHDLVDDENVEVVHNCTPVSLHKEINIYCIQKGKPIYSEKPLDLTTTGVLEQISELDYNPVVNAVGHQYRSNAAVHLLKKEYENSGKLLFFYGHYFQESLSRESDYSIRLVPENSPARVLSDLGSHLIDLIHFVTGQKIVEVSSTMLTHYPIRNNVKIESDDTTFIQAVLENGCMGNLMISKCAHGHKNDLSLTLCTEEAELSWNQEESDRYNKNIREKGNTVIYADKRYSPSEIGKLITLPPGHLMGYCDVLRDNIELFYNAVLSGCMPDKPLFTTFYDELAVNAVIDACINSSLHEGKFTEVNI